MFLRCKVRRKDGKQHRYWSVVENTRTARGRVVQRHVLYLGEINDTQELAWRRSIEVLEEGATQPRTLSLFPEDRGAGVLADTSIVHVKLSQLQLRRPRQWGACWLALMLWRELQLDQFWSKRLGSSRKGTHWDQVLFVLVAYRLLAPGSEWRLHREWFRRSALADLLGEDAGLAEIHKLYRCHDRLLVHKQAVFDHLTGRWRDLFNISYDVLLYDLTSTYFLVSLPSCLKNGAYYIPFSSAAASVDLPLAASTSNGITAFAYPPTVTSVTLPIAVNVASPSIPNKATNVTLALDTAGLSAYNLANGTSYLPLPDSVFTLSSMTVTIPAGKRLDTSITATINLAALDLSNAYVLPITIASASLPIEQWNHLFYYIAVKNQWDGKYSYQGYTLRSGDPVKTGNFTGQTMTLLTSGSNSVTFASLALWADATGIGIGNPTLTIDGSNNVTITSPGGATNQAGYPSRYDPATQTFYISFYWGAGPTSRLSTDTLSYTGPR